MKNYLWDFDGMLFDSYPHIAKAFEMMADEYGIEVDTALAQSLLEISFATCYEHYGITPEMGKRHNFHEHNYDLEPVVVPFENTYETLRILKERGAKHFLYTHRGRDTSRHYLEKYGMIDFFDGFVDSSMNFPQKPAPDAINYICENYGLDKSETIMTGDREIDVAAGKNAGIYSCLFTKKKNVTTVADFIVDDIIKVTEIQVIK